MKKTGLLLTFALFGWMGFAQDSDSTGLEGDNLDLNGVLELFKDSEDVEDFEKKLNSEDNGVNNLDLNDDGEVDYIRVVDHADSTSHALALQVPVSEDESQDVAVIAMDQIDDEEINLQVIGDSELYGDEYMVEPADEKNSNVVVNVYNWRPVRVMYGPRYRPYRSPWRWRRYPAWYRPWRPVAFVVYRPRVRRYWRPTYRRVRVRRCVAAHNHYHVHHVHSPWFKTKNAPAKAAYKTNHTSKKSNAVKTTGANSGKHTNKHNNQGTQNKTAQKATQSQSKPKATSGSKPSNKNVNRSSPTDSSRGATQQSRSKASPKKKSAAKSTPKSVTPTKRPGAKKSGQRPSGGGGSKSRGKSRGGGSKGGKRGR